ncbi:hypothetical protein C8D88_111279 [Lentzea atacamensis]|uniref:Uncharacterized protein n=1 Tax=Lentzea atacamensis TaxID=531938 RepID=A0A316HYW9_9PSEU|nr:hypothetical protein [Lentzea atacamensis]PWK83394.1 hypothetical protein C8D88_111279 [Lentzea atacamensis]
MSPEHSPNAPSPDVPSVPEQRAPVGEPVSMVDWFRSAPTGGTVFVASDD